MWWSKTAYIMSQKAKRKTGKARVPFRDTPPMTIGLPQTLPPSCMPQGPPGPLGDTYPNHNAQIYAFITTILECFHHLKKNLCTIQL
jgi:hypothetical protein